MTAAPPRSMRSRSRSGLAVGAVLAGALCACWTGAEPAAIGTSVSPAGKRVREPLQLRVRLERTHYGTVVQYRSSRILIEAMGRARNGLRNTASGPIQLKAPMPGRVVRLLVEEGQEVKEGEGIAVLEAMKMQNEFTAPRSGIVRRVSITEGATVSAGAILCVIE